MKEETTNKPTPDPQKMILVWLATKLRNDLSALKEFMNLCVIVQIRQLYNGDFVVNINGLPTKYKDLLSEMIREEYNHYTHVVVRPFRHDFPLYRITKDKIELITLDPKKCEDLKANNELVASSYIYIWASKISKRIQHRKHTIDLYYQITDDNTILLALDFAIDFFPTENEIEILQECLYNNCNLNLVILDVSNDILFESGLDAKTIKVL